MSTVQTMFKITASVNGTNAVRELNREIDKVSTSGEKMGRLVAQGAFALRGAFSSLAAGFGAMQIVRKADEFNLLRGRVARTTDTVKEANEAWRSLTGVALETGSQMEPLVGLFQRISGSKAELKMTNAELLAITETVAKLGALSGTKPENMDAGTTQLAQMLSLPKVQAQEWNSVMENIFAVGQGIAKEMGVTTGQMKNLVVEGKVYSKDVAVALYNLTVKAREEFDELADSPSRAAAQFATAFGIMAHEIDRTTGSTEAWVGVINFGTDSVIFLGKGIESVVNISQAMFRTVFGGLYSLFNRFMTYLAQTQYAIVATRNRLPFQNLDKEEADAKAAWMARDEYSKKYEAELNANIKADLAAASAAGKAMTNIVMGRGRSSALSPVGEKKEFSPEWLDVLAGRAGGGSKEAAKAATEETKLLKVEMEEAAKARADLFGAQASKELFAYADDAKNVGKSLGDAMTSAFRGAEDALIQFTKTGKLSVRDLANSVIEDLMRIQIRQSITGPLSSMLGSLFGGAQGSFAQASLRGAANPALYGPGFATGGSFKVGGSGGTDSQRVAFRASPGERVTISRGDQGGGFGNVSVTVNVQGGGDVEADSEKGKKLGQMMAAIAKSTIVNEKRPGGVLA